MSNVLLQQRLQSGYALHQRGQLDAAATIYREVIASEPKNAFALHFLGLVEASRGQLPEALRLLKTSLRLQPKNVSFAENYATALYLGAKYADAVEVCEQGLKFDPRNTTLLYTSAIANFRRRRHRDAQAQFDRLLLIQPNNAVALNERGAVLAELGDLDSALASIEAALRLEPDFADACLNRGNILAKQLRHEDALAAFDRALALKPALAKAWAGRAHVLVDQSRLEEALESYDRALALAPDDADVHGSRAICLQDIGRLSEARAAIDKAIALAPGAPSLYHTLAFSRRLARDDPRFAAMERLAQNTSSFTAQEKTDLHFALAKAYEDNQDYDRAFERFLAGNRERRRQLTYDEGATLGAFERIAERFPRERLQRSGGRGDSSSVPVFIVGMPRSGTTLVEQILASHSQVHGAGEVSDFPHALVEAGQRLAPGLGPVESVLQLPDEAFPGVGSDYVRRIRTAAPPATRILDKAPRNFRFIGAIRLALGQARIIHVRRDPLDTCFSCFSVMFRDHLPFTFDLRELGRYYAAYERLMQHWREALPPGAMLEVRYEDVVADVEGQARRLVAYCGLDWEDQCLEFDKNSRAVRTASVMQVRQPLYKTAIGRSRAFAGRLAPLVEELGGLA